jgi:hypothetical protein
MFCVPSVGTFEYAGTNFYKQNSAFLGFYESGLRRLLRVSGVGFFIIIIIIIIIKISVRAEAEPVMPAHPKQ